MNDAGAINRDEHQHMIAVVHRYVDALNAGDLDAIVTLYADDATVEDPVGSLPHEGRAAIRAFYAAAAAMNLVVALDGEIRVAARSCAFAFSVRFMHAGQPTTIRPIDLFDFDAAGRISRMRAYFGAPNIHH